MRMVFFVVRDAFVAKSETRDNLFCVVLGVHHHKVCWKESLNLSLDSRVR